MDAGIARVARRSGKTSPDSAADPANIGNVLIWMLFAPAVIASQIGRGQMEESRSPSISIVRPASHHPGVTDFEEERPVGPD
ncbi:MAG: hypothetical protein PHF93_10855, partial [Acidobacteriota bacterium]|nr:hypothetical protein [Acidobacteriota bacterium]MDW3227696.1 hypothetical protein [Acidobacteriota bacterium]